MNDTMNNLQIFWKIWLLKFKKNSLRWVKTWWPSIVIFILASIATYVLFCWGHDAVNNTTDANSKRSMDDIVRNYGLLIAACWGAFLAVWRSQIASRQAETSERGLRNERFQKGADMLGNSAFTVRMGGIYALERLAKDHPEDYLDQIIKLLSAFVRHPVQDEELQYPVHDTARPIIRPDIASAVKVACILNDIIDVKHDPLDFNHANLTGANLVGANLTDADLTGSNLTNADISKADFDKAQGLCQEQLDKACQNPNDGQPKNLSNVLNWDKEAAIERWEYYTIGLKLGIPP